MSSSSAGKFQDHYAVLGLDPKADLDAIQNAYTKLAQKYHPKSDTRDPEKFEAITFAYEILCDPMLRREFDKLKGITGEEGGPKFSGAHFFDALGREAGLRMALLCVLYDRRRTKPFTPSVSLKNIENILDATNEELNFTLWYLKQRSFATNDDKSNIQITVEGMDFLESNRPSSAVVMPFIKASALPTPQAAPAAANESGSRPRLGARLVGLLNHPTAAPSSSISLVKD
jgi:curved DNA-binding protein CbpA